MKQYSLTVQPKLRGDLVAESNDATKDLLNQISRHMGNAVVVQSSNGSPVPIRFNSDTGSMEVYKNNAWSSIGTIGATAAAPSTTKKQTFSNAYTPVADDTKLNIDQSTNPQTLVGTFTLPELEVTGDVGFFGTTPASQTTVADPTATGNADGEIGGLTFNATTYTPAEIEALRDKCEELADDVRALHSTVTALINALQSYGLV